MSDPEGSDPISVHRENASTPLFLNWNPDGEKLSFMTYVDPLSNGGAANLSLWTVDVTENANPRLLADGFPLFYSHEPDSDRAVVHIGGAHANNPEARLALFTPGGDSERGFELQPAVFQSPAWSPDGTQILLAVEDLQGRNALVLSSLQGQIRKTLTTFENSIAFSWAPDADYIGYIDSDRTRQGASGQLTILNPYTLDEIFVSEEQRVNAFFWSPDGEEIVYFTEQLGEDSNSGPQFYGIGVHFYNIKDDESR